LHGYEILKAFRIADVAKHHFVAPMGTLELMIAMNKQTYEKLPAAGKAAFQKHLGEKFARDMGEMQDKNAIEISDELKADPAHKTVVPPKQEEQRWRNAFEPVVAEWTKKHPNGEALVRAARAELQTIRSKR
jgi:TRAP-type C4-dicarboxylate transport system substrate-binding protein